MASLSTVKVNANLSDLFEIYPDSRGTELLISSNFQLWYFVALMSDAD